MRSILTTDGDGTAAMTTEPTLLKHTIDSAFKTRSAGGHGPSDWYNDTVLDSPCAAGHAMRLEVAESGIANIDLTGIPEHLHYSLNEGQRKFIQSLGGPVNDSPYVKRGSMVSRTA